MAQADWERRLELLRDVRDEAEESVALLTARYNRSLAAYARELA